LIWGRLSETRAGRRGAATISSGGGVLLVPLFLFTSSTTPLLIGALLMGVFGVGNFGLIPSYLNERFPTAARAAGAGFSYHLGAAASSLMPFIVGAMQDNGVALSSAMAGCIVITGALIVVLIWMGPETRGASLESRESVVASHR
jgi:MFS transporter, SHS family, lactate transporter